MSYSDVEIYRELYQVYLKVTKHTKRKPVSFLAFQSPTLTWGEAGVIDPHPMTLVMMANLTCQNLNIDPLTMPSTYSNASQYLISKTVADIHYAQTQEGTGT